VATKKNKIHLSYIYEEEMIGPVPFHRNEVDNIYEYEYGVYLLTKVDKYGVIVVVYVGRGYIKDRLIEHLSDKTKKTARYFYFKVLPRDDEMGFQEECRLYHLYGKDDCLWNVNHPPVPAGSPPEYPKCSELGCNGEP
jgi:hypothetical protein